MARHREPRDRWPATDRQLIAFAAVCVLALIVIPALILWRF